MHVKNLDLLFIIFFLFCTIIWTQIPFASSLPFISIVLALPLVLYLSGYALTQALFRKRDAEVKPAATHDPARTTNWKIGHPIGNIDQFVLSLGLSLTIDVLVGFLLNLLPIGLTRLSWTFSLSFLTLIFVVASILLRRKDVSQAPTLLKIRLTWQDCTLFALALLIIASAVALAVVRPFDPQPAFTQFWMLPANQQAKTCKVSLGIQSFESSTQAFNVILTVNTIETNAWPSIMLMPEQKWAQSVAVPPDFTGSVYIEARLYKSSQPATIYRDVHLTFAVAQDSKQSAAIQHQCTYNTQG